MTIEARPETKWPRPIPVPDGELDDPTLGTLGKLIWNTVARLFHDPLAMLIGSAFVLLMLWGHHGDLALLHGIWDGWLGPGSDPTTRGTVLPGIAWDQEWVSFWAGALLLVAVPILLIKLVFRQRLADYGLALPPPDRRRLTLLSAAALLAIGVPIFYVGAQDAGMQATYPLFRGEFENTGEFLLYQLGYLPFFLAIEFIFRGYLLFGLYGLGGTMRFGYYAILLSMLSYTAWHLGKPLPELWGTLVWGLVAGTIVLATRTIWAIVLVHWLLNVWLDLLIWQGW